MSHIYPLRSYPVPDRIIKNRLICHFFLAKALPGCQAVASVDGECAAEED
jgi:hypothetical protein